jgi:NADH-quinone oxidoreductase subunit E
MLTSQEREQIEAELAQYPDRKSACIDAMRIVQKHRGWLSDEALADIGELLGMSVADLDGVATFYNLLFRRKVGRHVIFVCDSVSCWIMGSDKQCGHLSQRLGIGLGETTADGEFTLLPIVCLGACDHAPVMMIDEDTHMDLDPAKIDSILERYK